MEFKNIIDLDEKTLYQEQPQILKILLKNQTTKKNIVWGTSSYSYLGKDFTSDSPIKVKQILDYPDLIQPRVAKSQLEQKERTKASAEVFTPTWLVNKQRGFVDQEFQSYSLEDFVDLRWLELTCGEAPYIVSRYDTVTGNFLPLDKRVGFLDKKLDRITKEITDKEEWLQWVKRAYQATYGYEYQGDSLLLARENLLMTFMDYYEEVVNETVPPDELKEFATIISYNLIQMDGLTGDIPGSNKKAVEQLSLFDDFETETVKTEKASFKNWKENKMIGFERLSSGESEMKFDVVIGNPPYQEEGEARDEPIYNYFIDSAFKVSRKACLITPARFLFNAGQTPKKWNEAMLNNPHVKVLFYKQKSSDVFPSTDIKGGVAVTYYSTSDNFGEIGTFTVFQELNSIVKKVERREDFSPFSSIVLPQGIYRFSEAFFENNPEALEIQGKGTKNKIVSKSVEKMPHIFSNFEDSNSNSIKILARIGGAREYRYIDKNFVNTPESFEKYKVLVPEANGTGAIGEVLSTPLIGHTDTFLTIGGFDSEFEANSLFKYIKTKFARALLGVLKVTQHNSRGTWAKVPLQDFTSSSDIDWSQSVAEIDAQLYKKYGLSEEEIAFIEEKVRAMD